jgi:hypothetical protein
VLLLSCGLADAATYSIPIVRNVETKSGVPVFIENFISCVDHSPYEGTAWRDAKARRSAANISGMRPEAPPTGRQTESPISI